jgi:hypothetical protein
MRAWLVIALATLPVAARAQGVDVRSACTGDAIHLCQFGDLLKAADGDLSGIRKCFTKHRRELSRPCDRVLKKHGY